jgi:hypothetical protein
MLRCIRTTMRAGQDRFDELLDLTGDRLAGIDVRAEAWRQGR